MNKAFILHHNNGDIEFHELTASNNYYDEGKMCNIPKILSSTKLLGNNKETMLRYLDFLNNNINIKCVYQIMGCNIIDCKCDKFVDVESQDGIKLLNIYDEGIKAHNDNFMKHWKKVWNV